MDETDFPKWDEKYRVIRCLKESDNKKTYLLEERNGWKRLICKIASGSQTVFLRQEYEILKRFSDIWRLETLELEEKEKACALFRDYLQGRTLADLVEQEGVLDAEEAAGLGIRLCRTLYVLHQETPPVIHRDMKPENLLVTGSGRIRFIDFETARVYKSERTTDTVCIGTRGYAAPEQFGYGQTDVRTDIYAVGKILLFLTTGDCEGEPARGGRREKKLGKIIRRSCAYDPSRRYADIRQLKKALQGLLMYECPAVRRLWSAGMAAVAVLFFLLGRYTRFPLLPNGAGSQTQQSSPAAEEVGWNPTLYKDSMDEILSCMQEGDLERMAAASETLVKELTDCEALRRVEPVAYWNLDSEELTDYYAGRVGYEFIADLLARGDGLIAGRLGTYAASAVSFARNLRARVAYIWTNDDGSTGSSALYQYVELGDKRNIDGCILEILDELYETLEQEPVQESEQKSGEEPVQESEQEPEQKSGQESEYDPGQDPGQQPAAG